MICVDDNGSPQQMLAILFERMHHANEILVHDAVASFCMCKAWLAYPMTQLTVLLLLETASRAVSDGSLSRTYLPSSHGATRMGVEVSHFFSSRTAALQSSSHSKASKADRCHAVLSQER